MWYNKSFVDPIIFFIRVNLCKVRPLGFTILLKYCIKIIIAFNICIQRQICNQQIAKVYHYYKNSVYININHKPWQLSTIFCLQTGDICDFQIVPILKCINLSVKQLTICRSVLENVIQQKTNLTNFIPLFTVLNSEVIFYKTILFLQFKFNIKKMQRIKI